MLTRSIDESANISELKNRRAYILTTSRLVKETMVRDCNHPVTRIARSQDENEELLALASQGKLRIGEGVLEASFWQISAPRVPAPALRRVFDFERDEN